MSAIPAVVFVMALSLSGVTPLTPDCYSPSGSSCDWYPNCIHKKYPCDASSHSYAMAYAYKYCKLYDHRKSLFSPDEWAWVSGVRRCLQVALVPVLKQSTKPTCQEIHDKGFKSHAPCYVNPGQGVPSICKLGCAVYIKIFRVIKSSLNSWYTFWEMMKATWHISKQCGFKCSITGL